MNQEEQSLPTLRPRTDMISPKEAGEILGVSARTVQRWAASGEIPSFRAGRTVRILLADLELMWRERKDDET